MKTLTIAALVAALAFGVAKPAAAQDDARYEAWPTRPVRLIAAAGPGGNPDVMARLLADKYANAFGKPFVVENMPGAGGVVAANLVSKAAPDGHVLMFGDSGALAINPALNPNVGYDPIKDFMPVTALVTLPTILVVHPDVPAKTLDEFVALAKKQPGKMSYGSAGAGSIHHLTFAIFAERAGIDLLHVPYRGGSAMVNGVLAGEIAAGWSGIPNVMELIAAGRLRGLCVSTLQRSPSTPQISTCDELGVKGFNVATMMGLQAPAGTSPKIVARLQAETAKVIREPAMATRMAQLGMVMEENGTASYAAFIKEDMARYEQAVKKLNLQQPK
ncbi:MAG: tripartite tricarboxylate transporter substrate binding protein [Xanthobacteraceae bacterium]|nr:tripartite tricarboxylate transporter substrate binding protein [Xanthobacteraceae bacterium]